MDDEIQTGTPGDKGKRKNAVAGFIANTERAAGGLPVRRMPNWMRSIVSWLQPRIGPRGVEFARGRVEMKAAETILHLRHAASRRPKCRVPEHVLEARGALRDRANLTNKNY